MRKLVKKDNKDGYEYLVYGGRGSGKTDKVIQTRKGAYDAWHGRGEEGQILKRKVGSWFPAGPESTPDYMIVESADCWHVAIQDWNEVVKVTKTLTSYGAIEPMFPMEWSDSIDKNPSRRETYQYLIERLKDGDF